jgi:hypothetical protein
VLSCSEKDSSAKPDGPGLVPLRLHELITTIKNTEITRN